ncbi:MAG: NHL repeat-containing protein [Nevskia sp.]|nr:NHL repeat-containing protein [Nevskia sp.]
MTLSIGGHAPARHRTRTLLAGLAAATLAGLAACGGNNNNSYCVNLSKASGVIGQPDFNSGSPNQNGAASASTVSGPFGSVATNGSVFYVDDTANNRILVYTTVPTGVAGAATGVIGQNDFSSVAPATTATSLAAPRKVSIGTDASGAQRYLVVADTNNNRVLIWDASLHGGQLPTSNVQADVVVGQTGFTTRTAATSQTGLNGPTAAMIALGTLVVVDQNNNRVLVWNSVPTSNGAPADAVIGQPDFTSNNQGTLSTVSNGTSVTQVIGLNNPSDLWTNGFSLFVSDTGNNRVLYWNQIPTTTDPTTNNMPNFVIGQTIFGANTSGSGTQHMNGPLGIYSDGSSLYVADTGNNRVLVFDSVNPLTTNGPAASGLFGQSDYSHVTPNDIDQNNKEGNQQNGKNDLNPTQYTLKSPSATYTDSSGNLYVTDRGNNRILVFPISSQVSGATPRLCTTGSLTITP